MRLDRLDCRAASPRRLSVLLLGVALPCCLTGLAGAAPAGDAPNVVFIMADDMGLGDVRSYTQAAGQAGVDSPVDTPNIDRVADLGMRFTNAHSPSAVCTPTRYGVLTGQYAWRVPLPSSNPQSGVLWAYDGPMIASSRTTIAEMLDAQGYTTAAFGKWHLGNTWPTTNGQPPASNGSNVDFSQPFAGGAVDNGFDSYFGDDVINQEPHAFIIDNLVAPSLPYSQVESLPEITRRSIEFLIDQNGSTQPFFMYQALGAPHNPILPPPGGVPADPSIGMGAYAYDPAYDTYENFIRLVDWHVGELIDTLEEQGLASNTILVFTTDNGVSTNYTVNDAISPGFVDGVLLRGRKADAWEGGHRVPLLVRWDGHVAPGSSADALVELNDVYATVADALDIAIPSEACEDSVSFLDVLLGDPDAPQRELGLQVSQWGSRAIRQLDEQGHEWKLIFGVGGGGFLSGGAPTDHTVEITPTTDFSLYQLYDLSVDPGETDNLLVSGGGVTWAELGTIQELQDILQEFIASGESASEVLGSPCDGSAHTGGCVPVVGTSGSASASSPQPFDIDAQQVLSQQWGIFFYGHGAAEIPFANGVLCVAAPLVRTPPQMSGGSGPCGGAFHLDFNAWIQSGTDPGVQPGDTIHGQFWFRDPAHSSSTALTGAVQFPVGP